MADSIVYKRGGDGQLVEEHESAVDPRVSSSAMLLRKFFFGKRDTLRCVVNLSAAVQGRHGTFIATVVNISRSGVLLHIDDESFTPAETANKLVAYSGRVLFHFEDGLRIALEGNVVLDAEIVRLTSAVDDVLGRILLAVQFCEVLTDEQCATLGLTVDVDTATNLDPNAFSPSVDDDDE